MMIAFMFYALLLYRLLRPVNNCHPMIMVGIKIGEHFDVKPTRM